MLVTIAVWNNEGHLARDHPMKYMLNNTCSIKLCIIVIAKLPYFNCLHFNINIFLHTVLYTFPGADKENLFNNQELLQLLIISFILMTIVFD